MAKFMFLARSAPESSCSAPPEDMSPEQMQQKMQAYMDWMQNGMEAGWLLDRGSGLKAEGAVVRPDLTVTDGPYAESKELLGGYAIVEAENLAAAVEIAKASPMPSDGVLLEVREISEGCQEGS